MVTHIFELTQIKLRTCVGETGTCFCPWTKKLQLHTQCVNSVDFLRYLIRFEAECNTPSPPVSDTSLCS